MAIALVDPDAVEETKAQQVVRLSRRTTLATLVLCLVLLVVALCMHRSAQVRPILKVLTWLVFFWSAIATSYATFAFFRTRGYHRHVSADRGLIDTLTGLPNRKGLVAALERFELGTQEFGRRTRLIDIDLSNLDRVNYEFGTMVGDAVLQDIAGRLATVAGDDHVVGRLGGDEFLVVMPQATLAEAESLARAMNDTITNYRLSLGDRGEVHSVKARVSVASYVPEQASLHETVVSAKEATAHGKLFAAEGEEGQSFYHVPRVTLGAFAARRWQRLSKAEQEEYKLWKRELTESITNRMCEDIIRMLDEKAETNWVDFVTAVPAAGGSGGGRTYATRLLAEAVARQVGVPYRDVMRSDASGPESRSIEPAVDAVIDKGESALLVSDVISSGIVERRCVKKLAAAGAHVQVVAWAAY